jgi:hypothetical protein
MAHPLSDSHTLSNLTNSLSQHPSRPLWHLVPLLLLLLHAVHRSSLSFRYLWKRHPFPELNTDPQPVAGQETNSANMGSVASQDRSVASARAATSKIPGEESGS